MTEGFESPANEIVIEHLERQSVKKVRDALGIAKGTNYNWEGEKNVPYAPWRLFMIMSGEVAAI